MRTMNDFEIRETLIRDTLIAAGMDDDNLHRTYSGPGMYGSKCFGFTGDTKSLARFFVALVAEACYSAEVVDERAELADDLIAVLSTDNMGTEKIFYFPGYVLV